MLFAEGSATLAQSFMPRSKATLYSKWFVRYYLQGLSVSRGKMPLTSPHGGPKLQSQTGFDGCEAVGSDSPIKRKSWSARVRTMLIRENEHFLLGAALASQAAE
jgi:hypothetical protein